MQAALGKVDGVKSVDVDYDAKTATVKTDGKVNAGALLAAFEGTQFKATVAKL